MQVSSYEVCNCTCMPPHMPKFIQLCYLWHMLPIAYGCEPLKASSLLHAQITFLTIIFLSKNVRKINFSFTSYSISLNQYMLQSGNRIATNDVACYLREIPLPNQKLITHRRIPILQVVNKIISIRLTLKLFTSLSKVYVNQRVVN